jgi:hypothetical protein
MTTSTPILSSPLRSLYRKYTCLYDRWIMTKDMVHTIQVFFGTEGETHFLKQMFQLEMNL